jgi:hypothetical protein
MAAGELRVLKLQTARNGPWAVATNKVPQTPNATPWERPNKSGLPQGNKPDALERAGRGWGSRCGTPSRWEISFYLRKFRLAGKPHRVVNMCFGPSLRRSYTSCPARRYHDPGSPGRRFTRVGRCGGEARRVDRLIGQTPRGKRRDGLCRVHPTVLREMMSRERCHSNPHGSSNSPLHVAQIA